MNGKMTYFRIMNNWSQNTNICSVKMPLVSSQCEYVIISLIFCLWAFQSLAGPGWDDNRTLNRSLLSRDKWHSFKLRASPLHFDSTSSFSLSLIRLCNELSQGCTEDFTWITSVLIKRMNDDLEKSLHLSNFWHNQHPSSTGLRNALRLIIRPFRSDM